MKKAPKGYTARIEGAEIDCGARVILNALYGGDHPKKYYVTPLSPGFCLLADNKKDYNEGRGYIYYESCIDFYEPLSGIM